jgi:hypothetical protein
MVSHRSTSGGASNSVEMVCSDLISGQSRAAGLARFCDVFRGGGAFHCRRGADDSCCAHGSTGLARSFTPTSFTDRGGAALAAELGRRLADHLECAVDGQGVGAAR